MKVLTILILAMALADTSLNKIIPTSMDNIEETTADLDTFLDIADPELNKEDYNSVLDIGQIHDDRKRKHIRTCKGKLRRCRSRIQGKTESGAYLGLVSKIHEERKRKNKKNCKGKLRTCRRRLQESGYNGGLVLGLGGSNTNTCVDSNRKCAKRAADGKCNNGRTFVNCKLSCACGLDNNPPCEDSDSNCSTLVAEGKCSKGGTYRKCKASCACAVCSEADGFFQVSNLENHCYKFFPESRVTWEAAKSLCEAEGLMLATRPDDPVALRKLLVETYGDNKRAWIGAKGTGDSYYTRGAVQWISDGTAISNSDSAWWHENAGGMTWNLWCLYLLVDVSYMDEGPTKPYYMNDCNRDFPSALCEVVV